MITNYDVICGDNYPQELEINVDTVYKRYNIRRYTDFEGNKGYQYDEDQMTLEEYFKKAIPEIQQALAELSILIAG